MKLTKERLKTIIKEELEAVIKETMTAEEAEAQEECRGVSNENYNDCLNQALARIRAGNAEE
jgi:uncharacterized membrane protein